MKPRFQKIDGRTYDCETGLDFSRGPQIEGPEKESVLLFLDAIGYCMRIQTGRCLYGYERKRLNDAIEMAKGKYEREGMKRHMDWWKDWTHWRDIEEKMAFGEVE